MGGRGACARCGFCSCACRGGACDATGVVWEERGAARRLASQRDVSGATPSRAVWWCPSPPDALDTVAAVGVVGGWGGCGGWRRRDARHTAEGFLSSWYGWSPPLLVARLGCLLRQVCICFLSDSCFFGRVCQERCVPRDRRGRAFLGGCGLRSASFIRARSSSLRSPPHFSPLLPPLGCVLFLISCGPSFSRCGWVGDALWLHDAAGG